MKIQSKKDEPAIPAGLSVIHSNQMEDLRKVAVQWIRKHPLKPLENEVFIVQSNGMAQWLKLALAETDGCGICAALDIQLPARFLWRAYRAVLTDEKIPRHCPYDKDRLVWRLLQLLPSLFKYDGFSLLKQYLIDDDDQRKHYQLSCRLADLYDQYQVYRADWLEDWSHGADHLRNAFGIPAPIPVKQAWQAELWRKIGEDVPEDRRRFSRSELHRRFLAVTENQTLRPKDLPRRVIVFGISSLPKQALEALHAVSRYSQVLMFVHNPCRHYWADIIEDRKLLRIERARHKHKSQSLKNLSPELLHQHVNPLLAAWGKQGRDYIGLLYGYDQPDAYRQRFAEIDLFTDFEATGKQIDLLSQVQQAILDLQPLPKTDEEKQLVSAQDQSISFHIAYSRQREVEILQDQLLSLFGRYTDLTPQEIIVMMPDIDVYTAHIEAVFGRLQPRDLRYIPYTIADRPERTSIPMMQAFEKLLHLPSSRFTVSDLMDLLEVPAFRERFGLKEENISKLHQWIEGAGIRWGLSAEQRRDFDLPAGFEQNTWLFGLRRMLLGYAVGTGASWQGIEPYDDIGGLEAAIVGPLAVIMEQLEKNWQTLRRSATPTDWNTRILGLIKDFFIPTGDYDELTLSRMEDALEQWASACADAGLEEKLTLPVVRQALLGAMKDASVSQRFLAGRVNFCTMMPMRAIPFEVVCLLGMNDGEYPRSSSPLGFDLMSGSGRYRPGDRSRREDDRYLCLEALLSARKKLYVSYIGRSVQDNSHRMPSVLVGQLMDYLAAGWQVSDSVEDAKQASCPLMEQLTFRHPMQPFSKTYFQQDQQPRLFTYATEWRRVHETPDSLTNDPCLDVPNAEGALQLNSLIRFLKNPIPHFFNQRLNIYFDGIDTATENLESFKLAGLAPFRLRMQLLNTGLAIASEEYADAVFQAAQRLRHTGELPLNGFGEMAIEQLTGPVMQMLKHHHDLCRQWPDIIDGVELCFPIQISGCVCKALEDWLDRIRSSAAGRFARWEFYPLNIMGPRNKIENAACLINPWVKHLAGCAQGLALTSYLIAPDTVIVLTSLDRTMAQKQLNTIIGYWWQGLSLPLPVTAKTAFRYLSARFSEDDEKGRQKAYDNARKVYEGDGYRNPGELGYGDAAYLKRCYPNFEALWQAKQIGFETLADELYAPLVQAVEKGTPA